MLLNCGVGEDSWEVLWAARRPNQSILKEISPEYSLEWLMLKLKLQYFIHLMWRTDSLKRPWCWGRLKEGGEGDDRGWDAWMASLTQWAWVWVSWELVTDREANCAAVYGSANSHTWLSDWTEMNRMKVMETCFKRSCAGTDTLSAPDPAAGHRRPMPPLKTPGHSQAGLAQSLVGLLLLSPGSWCAQGFVCAHQESVSPVL